MRIHFAAMFDMSRTTTHAGITNSYSSSFSFPELNTEVHLSITCKMFSVQPDLSVFHKTCPEDWQTTKHTIKDRCSFLFNNELLSDIRFTVPVSDESESKKSKHEIFAHKFLLSISSPVFYTMFYGAMAETRETVELPDCDYEVLVEFLRYIYCDELTLSESNVSGVLYLSNKYMMPPLADKCREFLVSNMYPSNVFSVLSVAESHEEEKIVNLCWKMIDGQAEAALRERIERPRLETIVTRDTLKIEEVKLFAAVDKWATRECEQNGLTPDGKTKRTVLGEEIIKAIRFPVMEPYEFRSVVTSSGILSDEEVTLLQKYFDKTLDGPIGFPEHCRLSHDHLDRCRRFRYIHSKRTWSYDRGEKDSLVFEVSKSIKLYGLRLFGNYNSNYSVNLELIKERFRGITVFSQTGNFTSVPLSDEYQGFEFLFDQPVDINANTKYRVEALISGPPSRRGKSYYQNVDCFTFSTSDTENNGTNDGDGQFSEFLFL